MAGLVAGLMTSLAVSPVANADQGAAKLRMGYFSSDSQTNVDFYVDGQKAWSNIGYKTISSYLSFPSGQHTLAVRPAGQSDATPLAQVDQALNADTFYTGIAAGKQGQQKAAVFQDGFTTPPSGMAVARFIHLAPEVPGVDVAVKNGPVLFNNISFFGGSVYATVKAGTYDLELHQAGTDKVLFSANGVQVAPGTVQTMIGSGGVGQPVELVKVLDASSAPVTPQGGAATGAGGLALRQAVGLQPVLISLLLAALLLVVGRRQFSR